jgi:hypothetical protein
MPSIKRERDKRMKLRHSQDLKKIAADYYPEVEAHLRQTAADLGSHPEDRYLRPAVRYLAKAMAEYHSRKKLGVADAKHNPTDEALWLEDKHLERWKTDSGGPSPDQIDAARKQRKQIMEANAPATSEGGTRYNLANALRHAWLICHEPNMPVSYGRQTNKENQHVGRLHGFIAKLTSMLDVSISVDGMHKLVREIDRELLPKGASLP